MPAQSTLTPIRVVLAATLIVALAFGWTRGGRRRWRSLVGERFVYGVPWGTIVTVAVVVAFYLLVQDGLRNWNEPLTLPFITWSVFYPTGLLTAGVAHGSPAHLGSNVAGTLVVAPIAEYAWSHYPSARGAGDPATADGGNARRGPAGLLARPAIRAVVIFPAALLAIAFLTALFSLGPGLGFSGAVFAILGFAVVNYPFSTVVAVVGTSALRTVASALRQPVVRESVAVETPAPPEWAGIGFQAHLVGFLLGVLLAIALLRYRNRAPAGDRIFLGTLLVGLIQALWLVGAPVGDGEYALYRGGGVAFVLLLSMLIAVAVAGRAAVPRPLAVLPRAPTTRQLAIGGLVLLTVAVAVPGLVLGVTVVEDDAVPGSGSESETEPKSNAVVVEDYVVTYAENATSERQLPIDVDEESDEDQEQEPLESARSGVVVVSEERELWTLAVRETVLEYERTATVRVGGVGWRETVRVERTGWAVTGNESAYAVDLTVDGETTRAFASEPVRAEAVLDGYEVVVVPTDDGFELGVLDDGTRVGEAPLPPANETTTVDGVDMRVSTEVVGDAERVFAETDDARVQIAERETYPRADHGSESP